MKEKGYVFISYSSKDSLFVSQLTDFLESCGISYWKAPDMIPAGSNYAKEIPKAIRDCHAFLLVLSEAAQNSIWIEKEIDVAICCRKRIIPLKIDNAELSDLYRFYLNNVQTVDIFTGRSCLLTREHKERLGKVFAEYTYETVTVQNRIIQDRRREEFFGGSEAAADKESTVSFEEYKGNESEEATDKESTVSFEEYKESESEEATEKEKAIIFEGYSENKQEAVTKGKKLTGTDTADEKAVVREDTGRQRRYNLAGLLGGEKSRHMGAQDIRSNALRINKIPLKCEYCGGYLRQSSLGIYNCVFCGKEHYDDLRKVRNYLEEVGAAPAVEISKKTGVSINTIEYFRDNDLSKDGMATDTKNICSICGAAVQAGETCRNCENREEQTTGNSLKGVWHSTIWKR